MIDIIQSYPITCMVAAFIVGGWFGVGAACVMVCAHNADKRIERERLP